MLRLINSIALGISSRLADYTRQLFGFFMSGRAVGSMKATVAYTNGVAFSKTTLAKTIIVIMYGLLWLGKTFATEYFNNGAPPFLVRELINLVLNAPALDAILDLLLITVAGYAVFSYLWAKWRHQRVLKAITDLNYRMYDLERRSAYATMSLSDLVQTYCDCAARVFQAEDPGGKIGCAYRSWCDEVAEGSGGYVTVARSGNLDKRRATTSEPLTDRSPLLRLLRGYEWQNCLAFSLLDTERALADDPDNNRHDDIFSREDRSMLVARIFARDKYDDMNDYGDLMHESSEVMTRSSKYDKVIGVFYITSSKTYVFNGDEIDLFIYLTENLNSYVLHFLDAKEERHLKDILNEDRPRSKSLFMRSLEKIGINLN